MSGLMRCHFCGGYPNTLVNPQLTFLTPLRTPCEATSVATKQSSVATVVVWLSWSGFHWLVLIRMLLPTANSKACLLACRVGQRPEAPGEWYYTGGNLPRRALVMLASVGPPSSLRASLMPDGGARYVEESTYTPPHPLYYIGMDCCSPGGVPICVCARACVCVCVCARAHVRVCDVLLE